MIAAALSPEQEAELALAKAQLEETLELSKEVQEAVEDGYGYDNLFYEDDLRELALQLRLNGGRVLEIALNFRRIGDSRFDLSSTKQVTFIFNLLLNI